MSQFYDKNYPNYSGQPYQRQDGQTSPSQQQSRPYYTVPASQQQPNYQPYDQSQSAYSNYPQHFQHQQFQTYYQAPPQSQQSQAQSQQQSVQQQPQHGQHQHQQQHQPQSYPVNANQSSNTISSTSSTNPAIQFNPYQINPASYGGTLAHYGYEGYPVSFDHQQPTSQNLGFNPIRIINKNQFEPTQIPQRPKLTTTFWEDESTVCYQVEARGTSVSRREDTNFVNGTKLLNVAGMTRGRRDGILKSEKIRYVVKIGAMNLKGVWVPFERAVELARNEGILDILYPLFVKDIKELYHGPQFSGGLTAAANQNPKNIVPVQVTNTNFIPHVYASRDKKKTQSTTPPENSQTSQTSQEQKTIQDQQSQQSQQQAQQHQNPQQIQDPHQHQQHHQQQQQFQGQSSYSYPYTYASNTYSYYPPSATTSQIAPVKQDECNEDKNLEDK